jgi:hypothetical protein
VSRPLPAAGDRAEVVVNGRQVDFVYPLRGEPGFGRTGHRAGRDGGEPDGELRRGRRGHRLREGRNLGNSRYEPANGYLTPGRSLLVGTRFTF